MEIILGFPVGALRLLSVFDVMPLWTGFPTFFKRARSWLDGERPAASPDLFGGHTLSTRAVHQQPNGALSCSGSWTHFCSNIQVVKHLQKLLWNDLHPSLPEFGPWSFPRVLLHCSYVQKARQSDYSPLIGLIPDVIENLGLCALRMDVWIILLDEIGRMTSYCIWSVLSARRSLTQALPSTVHLLLKICTLSNPTYAWIMKGYVFWQIYVFLRSTAEVTKVATFELKLEWQDSMPTYSASADVTCLWRFGWCGRWAGLTEREGWKCLT